jgi:carbon monoxide dehydrogenase subunit G
MTIISRARIQRAGAAALAAALTLSAEQGFARDAGRAVTAAEPVAVSVTSDGNGSYRIEGSFQVPSAPATVWGVLTDYDRLPSFVSSMRSSVASRDRWGRLFVTQEAVGRVGPFSRRMHVVLETRETAPTEIAFRDVGEASFRSYVGAWTISARDPGARVSYVLDVAPRSAPKLFGRSIVASNARRLLEQVRAEVLRRTDGGPPR